MEWEVLLTGIGGQGVQLAAKTLAVAAIHDGRQAMTFGVYGGTMRGGNTDATVIVGDGRLLTPPTVDEAGTALVMHHDGWSATAERLRPGAKVVVDTSVFRGDLTGTRTRHDLLEIEATAKAAEIGHAPGASMVALGAFAAFTGIVTLDALTLAAREVLPPYRAQHAERNIAALEAGHREVLARTTVTSP